jgi:cytochrome b
MEAPTSYPGAVRAPLHFWAVGLLLVLWNCWGLLGSIAAQVDLFPNMPAEAAAYLDRQPVWFMVLVDCSPLAGVAGAISLLVQSRWAPRLFVVQIGVLVLATAYEMAIGTSPLLTVPAAWASTAFLLALLAAQTAYAHRMARRGLLT